MYDLLQNSLINIKVSIFLPAHAKMYILNQTEDSKIDRERLKLLNRSKRLRGQLAAVERALEADEPCPDVLMQLAAVRGGVNSLMAEVLEDHIRLHVAGGQQSGMEPAMAEDLIGLVRAYLK